VISPLINRPFSAAWTAGTFALPTAAPMVRAVAGTRGGKVYDTGDTDYGIWSAGQTQGLIHDIPTCKELMARIITEAQQIIRARLDKMVA